jgi:hypothetical protein
MGSRGSPSQGRVAEGGRVRVSACFVDSLETLSFRGAVLSREESDVVGQQQIPHGQKDARSE